MSNGKKNEKREHRKERVLVEKWKGGNEVGVKLEKKIKKWKKENDKLRWNEV